MDAKVSRRAALGVIIAALAAGPFAIRSLRKKKPNISHDEAPYDNTLSVNPDLVQTDLSPEQLQDALNMLLAEREMWLKFRGVSVTIKVIPREDRGRRRRAGLRGVCPADVGQRSSRRRSEGLSLCPNVRLLAIEGRRAADGTYPGSQQ